MTNEKPNDGVLRIWAVYDHPRDYPGKYVARLWEVTAGRVKGTQSLIIADTLEVIHQQMMEMQLSRLTVGELDDPVIIETWL